MIVSIEGCDNKLKYFFLYKRDQLQSKKHQNLSTLKKLMPLIFEHYEGVYHQYH